MFIDKIMHTLFLALGSNLGDRRQFLRRAIRQISQKVGPVVRASSIYETKPVGYKNQRDFLNMVLHLQTDLKPQVVLKITQKIEHDLGRVRTIKNGPRTIDIDLLLYDRLILKDPDLLIPHPRMHERRFVLEPLAEISPRKRHPVLKKTVASLLRQC